jgi:hypothetical protein
MVSKFTLLYEMGYEVCEERKIFYSTPKTEEEYFFPTLVPPHQKNPHNPFSNLCLEPGIFYRLLDITSPSCDTYFLMYTILPIKVTFYYILQ